MIDGEPCLLYTQDAELAQTVLGHLRKIPGLKHVDDSMALKRTLEHDDPALVILDSRAENFRDLCNDIRTRWPDSPIVVIGPRRSDPVIKAEEQGVFAVLDLDFDGGMLKQVVRQAFERLALFLKVRVLEEKLSSGPGKVEPTRAAPADRQAPPSSLRHSFPPLRRFGDVDAMLQGTMDEIVNAGVVLRAGAFVYDADSGAYRFAAGIGCAEETTLQEFAEDTPFIRWLEKHAQLVCRSELQHVADTTERVMLERSLNRMQAELLVPLLGRQRIVGWILLGKLATGAPFAQFHLRDVMVLAERVSTALENAMLYREVARQKTLAETLLQSVPTGIVAVREDGRIYWFNEAAQRILNVPTEEADAQPVEALGPRLADQLRGTLAGRPIDPRDTEWFDARSQRHISVQTVRLMNDKDCSGAVAFIHDLTRERLLTKRQREVDRSAFWTELAANMSHEIRNPLVAIKTFAQLLPERYQDEEFRNEFSVLVSQEVDRLNALIEQINSFAEFPEPVFECLDVREPLQEGIKLAQLRVSGEKVDVRSFVDPDLPKVRGDRRALTECFAHIVANSLEALEHKGNPKVKLNVRTIQNGNVPRGVEVTLSDNAGGIDPNIKEKVFSPFCTGRNGGMGLGLPIVQRTVSDHDGRVHVDSDAKGTQVTIVLPAHNAKAEDLYETPVNS